VPDLNHITSQLKRQEDERARPYWEVRVRQR